MIEHNLDTTHSILYVRPKTSLEQDDFLQIAKTVDPYIEESGILSGLIIEAPEFAGWNNFGAVVAHFRFVREHHKHIKRVGLVTDSTMGDIAAHLAAHFVSAKIKHFAGNDLETAKKWILVRS
jgi:hypothetical protein